MVFEQIRREENPLQYLDLEQDDSPEAKALLAIRKKNLEDRRAEKRSHEARVIHLDDIAKKENRTPGEERYLKLVEDGQATEKKEREIRERIKNLKIESGEAEVKPSKK